MDDKTQIKKWIYDYLSNGIELSKIQTLLSQEHQIQMTFFELRLLASELDSINWNQFNPQKKEEDQEPTEKSDDQTKNESDHSSEEALNKNDSLGMGKTTVTLSKILRPGAIAGGSVQFASGVSAEWSVDQFGRLGLDKPSGQPTAQDIQEFQTELQKVLAGSF